MSTPDKVRVSEQSPACPAGGGGTAPEQGYECPRVDENVTASGCVSNSGGCIPSKTAQDRARLRKTAQDHA